MTDNAKTFLSKRFQRVPRWLDIRHKTTPPYTPRVNGKVERFIRTLLNEWAYAHAYPSTEARNAYLPEWLHFYNWYRQHSSLKKQATIPTRKLGEQFVSATNRKHLTQVSAYHKGDMNCIDLFLQKNRVYGTTSEDGELKNLWGHSGISLSFQNLPAGAARYLCEILSNIYLPSHMRAIAHEDRKSIEFIYSFELTPVKKRSIGELTISIPSHEVPISVEVGFAPGSKKLAYLTLAVNLTEIEGASHEFVNLQHLRGSSLPFLIEKAKEMKLGPQEKAPFKDIILQLLADANFLSEFKSRLLSFWLTFEDAEVFNKVVNNPTVAHEIFKATNFYLLSFDRGTPLIVIEDRKERGPLLPTLPRRPWGEYPTRHLVKIDTTLYNYIERAFEAKLSGAYIEMFRSSFQAIEHIAYKYGNKKVRDDLKAMLSRYDALINLDATINKIYSAVLEGVKQMDAKKTVISDILQRASIHTHTPIADLIHTFNNHDDFFKKKISFEGGFVLQPLPSLNKDNFSKGLAANLVDIRNAIVHVKDHKANNTIIPNKVNSARIAPYSFLSMEIAIYLADFYSKFE